MQLIYNDIDITNDIDIISASTTDNCGGKADCIDLVFSDSQKLWRQWEPKKDDRIILTDKGFSSGLMFVDQLGIKKGKFNLNAISTPLKSKSNNSKSWENIRFKEMAKQLVEEIGLQIETYGIGDYLYDRLDMINKTNLEFLNERCVLEGYSLKITNGKAIIYDEKLLEQCAAVKDITEDLFIGDYNFDIISSGLYASCEIEHFSNEDKLIKYKFAPENAPIGPVFKIDMRATNQGEADRYTEGILRKLNKNEVVGNFYLNLDTSLAAGNTVNLKNIGMFSGKYFIKSIKHMHTAGKSYLKVRKVLEGY